jgi:hypothetical protein
MAQQPTKQGEEVKSLIVGPGVHQRLKAFCKENGFLIRPFVEKIITEALDNRLEKPPVTPNLPDVH